MTPKQYSRLMDLAIEALIEREKKRPRIIQAPIRKRRLTADEQSHKDYCEDMQAIGDETGTAWGGNFGHEV